MLELNENTHPIAWRAEICTASTVLVEEFMLVANEVVAKRVNFFIVCAQKLSISTMF